MQNTIKIGFPAFIQSHEGFKKILSSFEVTPGLIPSQESDQSHLFDYYSNLILENEIDIAILPLTSIPVDKKSGIIIGALSERYLEGTTIIVHHENVDMASELRLATGTKIMAFSHFTGAQVTALNSGVTLTGVNPGTSELLQALSQKTCDAILIDRLSYESIMEQSSSYKVIQLNPRELIPSPGSGVLACITHQDNMALRSKLKSLHNKEIAVLTNIERKILKIAGSPYLGYLGAYVYQDAVQNFHASAIQSKTFHQIHFSQSTSSGLPDRIIQALHLQNNL